MEENTMFEPQPQIPQEKLHPEKYTEPDKEVKKKERMLRDDLAIRRTRLAEERTQLSYIRTGVNLLLGGFFFIGYFEPDTIFSYLGYATIVIALIFLLYGFYYHRKSMNFLNKLVEITLKEESPYIKEEEEAATPTEEAKIL